MQFKDYFSLFKRKCDITSKDIISIHPSDSPYTVYSQEYWWSDKWNPLDFWKDYDKNNTIFEQIDEIFLRTPVPALDNSYLELENSEYINGNGASKDCYLVSMGSENEKCLYSWNIASCRYIIDVYDSSESESCSRSGHLWKCYNIHNSWDCWDCRDSIYISSCYGSQYLIGCISQRNTKYQILNISCTEKEFHDIWDKLHRDEFFRKEFEKKYQELIEQVWLDQYILTRSENCTGDFCYDSKNVISWFLSGDIKDSAYIYESQFVEDSMDINQWGNQVYLSYDNIAIGDNMHHIYWSVWSWGGCEYHFYTSNCQWWHHLFGCSGLKHASYCIFNMQYTKEEW